MAGCPHTAERHTMACGCGPIQKLFVVGLRGQDLGYRIWQAPTWVRTQQVRELFELQQAIKLAGYRGHTDIDIVGDNPAGSRAAGTSTTLAPAAHPTPHSLNNAME